MTGADFVRLVMERLDVTTAADLAEKMHWRRKERTVARWLAGHSEPSFAYTLEMAMRAGMLRVDADAIQATDSPPATSEERRLALAQLEDRLAKLADAEDKILAGQSRALRVQQDLRRELQAIRGGLGIADSSARAAPKQKRGQR